MIKKLKRLLLSERGDSSYISSFIYILVVVILVVVIINVFHIISVKQEMDHIADQIVKQIQLNHTRMFGRSGFNATHLLRGQPLLLARREMDSTGALQNRFCVPAEKKRMTATIQKRKGE